MSNSVDPDETEPSHLDLCCLQKSIIIACGSERVNVSNRNEVGGFESCQGYVCSDTA